MNKQFDLHTGQRSYLDHDELRWQGYREHESVKNGCRLMQYLYRRSKNKGDLAEERRRLREVAESDMR